jgi:cation diffusion facilitator family transporter
VNEEHHGHGQDRAGHGGDHHDGGHDGETGHGDHGHDGGHGHGGDHDGDAAGHGHGHDGDAGHGDHGHDGDAGHGDHGHGHGGGGPVGWLRHAFAPHSHDAAARTDTALETSRRGMRTLGISFAVLLLTAGVQAAVVTVSGSVALLGDTLHNVADALTAVPLAIAFSVGRRAATRRFTYGYGRAEDLAGIAVVTVIAVSSAAAAYAAVERLVHPRDVRQLGLVATAALAGFVGNEVVARYRITVGRQIGSAALVADGLHARTDGFTSLAVLLGAAGVWAGFPLADPLVGLLITVAILLVLREAAREVYHRLMDAVDPALVDRAERILLAVAGVRGVAALRIRWIGHTLRAEVDVLVDYRLSVVQAHHIAAAAEHRLIHELPRLGAATVHADPDGPDTTDHHHELTGHR